MLKCENVSVIKRNKQILFNNSLQLLAGEIVCIVGKNGAGKSTLLRALTGLEELDTGTVVFNEIDMLSKARQDAFDKLGVLLNNNVYYEHLNCYENLSIISKYYGTTQFKIDEIISLFGLEDFTYQKVKHLSTGTKQRLSLAITFINRPSFVILDEPFNSIDRENTRQIVKLIRMLNQKYDTAFLITSHSFDDIESLYTSLSVLKSGHIVYSKSRETLEKTLFIRLDRKGLVHDLAFLRGNFENMIIEDEYIDIAIESEKHLSLVEDMGYSIQQERKATVKDIYELVG